MSDERDSADAARVTAYLDGSATTFREIDGWIRAELGRRYGRLASEHEDLSQVVHENLLRNLRADKFKGLAPLRQYVAGIVHYVAIARLRLLYKNRALSESLAREGVPVVEDNPYRTIEALDRKKLLHQLFLSLSEDCRELWRLVYGETLAYADVAKKLGIPAGTVKSRMWHCRKKAMAILRRIGNLGRKGSPR